MEPIKIPDTKARYLFHTKEFAVSERGFHWLRSKYNYKTIRFADIKSIRIEKGIEIPNWILIFFMGSIILWAGIHLLIPVVDVLIYQSFNSRYAAWLIYLLLIPLGGAYFVYLSLRRGLVIKIRYLKNSKDKFPLKEIIWEQKLEEFIKFMNEKSTAKVIVGKNVVIK